MLYVPFKNSCSFNRRLLYYANKKLLSFSVILWQISFVFDCLYAFIVQFILFFAGFFKFIYSAYVSLLLVLKKSHQYSIVFVLFNFFKHISLVSPNNPSLSFDFLQIIQVFLWLETCHQAFYIQILACGYELLNLLL